MTKTRGLRATALVSGGALMALVLAGCGGGSHFQNEPRPPITAQLTGVVTDKQVTVSPDRIDGGPIRLVISNQTQQAHTITLERSGNQGEPNRDVVGPVNPLAAATVQQTLTQGEYQVSVDSKPGAIAPAKITVGPNGKSGSNNTQLP